MRRSVEKGEARTAELQTRSNEVWPVRLHGALLRERCGNCAQLRRRVDFTRAENEQIAYATASTLFQVVELGDCSTRAAAAANSAALDQAKQDLAEAESTHLKLKECAPWKLGVF